MNFDAGHRMKPPPPPEIQIMALLTCRASRLTAEWAGEQFIPVGEHRTVFTVSRSDVHRYVRANGVPQGAWSDTPSSVDGLYMVESDGRYSVYLQDRGREIAGNTFRTRRTAEIALTNWLLAISGTGLFATTHRETGPTSPLQRMRSAVARFLWRRVQ